MMTKALPRILTFALVSTLAIPAGAQTWQRLGPAYPVDGTAAGVGPMAGGGTTLFAGTGNQLGDFRSTDGGVTWTATGSQIFGSDNRALPALTFFRSSTGRLFRGVATASFENRVGSPLWYSDNDGVSWTEVAYANFQTAINNGAVSVTGMAESNGILFAADELSEGVWKSTDDGITWTKARNGLPAQPFLGNVINSGIAAHGGTVIVANPTYGLYRSTDGGASWTQSVDGIPGTSSPVGTIRVTRDVAAATDGTFYAGSEKHLWKSSDDGQNWTLLTSGFNFGDIASIAVDGTKLYAYTTSATLLESTDGGESFAIVNGGTPAPYRGSNHRQLVVRDGVALYSGFYGTYRLDLNAATRTPIAPTILAQPVGGGVNVGTSFTFTVTTTRATAPITYTWRRGSTVVATTSVPSFTISSATLDDAGSWNVTISNAAATVVSNAVDLVVAPFAPGQIDYSFVPLVIRDLSSLNAGALSSINVNSIAMGRDGEVFAVGSWSAPSLSFYRWTVGLARIGANGVLDTDFLSHSGVLGGTVAYAALPLDDGTMIVGGGVLGNSTAQFFRKINRAGTIEPSFVWPATFNAGTYALLAGPTGSGTAYAAGAYGVRRFFTASGEEDPSFNPPQFPTTNYSIRALANGPDGSLIVGGSFTSINGIAQNRIARIRSDGSLDVTFAPSGVGSSNGFNNEIYALAVQPDGKVVVGGGFTAFGGTSTTTLVRLNADGTLDTGFVPGAVNGGVYAIAIGLDGGIYVGGTFSTIGGAAANRLARLQGTNGALDTTFPGQVSNANVNALTVQPDGRLLVGNAQTAYRVLTPAVTTPRIARFSRDQAIAAGTPVTLAVTLAGDVAGATFQWHKDGAPLAGRTTATLPIASFSAADEGAYHVVVTVGATVLTSPTARLDLLGAPEFVRPPVAVIAYPEIAATLVGEARGVGPLSYQWTKDGVPVSGGTNTFLYFANPTTTDAGDYRLTVTGPGGALQSQPVRLSVMPRPMSRDPGFTFAPGSTFSIYSAWSALAQSDGSFLLGGHFTVTGGTAVPAGTYYLLHVNADGTIRTAFDSTTYGLQAAVKSLVRLSDGKVFVGDVRQPRRLLANLQPDPSYTPADLGNFGENVTAQVVQPDDKVIVGFGSTNGTYTRLARLNANGTIDTAFPDLDPNGSVTAILREADGTLFVAGTFTTIGGVARNGFARITPAGTVDASFAPPARTAMYGGVAAANHLARGPDGMLYLAGNFSMVGAIPANGLARFDANGNPDPRFYLTGRTGMEGYAVAFTGDRILLASARGSIPPGTSFVAETFRMNGALDPASEALTVATSSGVGYGFLPLDGGRHLVLGSYNKVISSSPTVSVFSPVAAYTGTPGIAIGTQPQPAVVDLGGSVTLTGGAFGTSAIQYQWYRDGQLLPGKTGANLVINPVTRGDEGTYTVVATNASGTVTSRGAFVDVRAEPEIVTAPQSVTRPVGQTVELTVVAVGAGQLSYRWTKGGVDLADAGNISGSATGRLQITNAQETDSGIYAVRVTNAIGSTTSATAVVNVVLQPGTLNAAWVPAIPNGSVQQVLVRADGRILIVATPSSGFTTVGGAGNSRPAVALLNEDGTLNTTFASTQSLPAGYTRRFVLGPDGLTPYAAVTNGATSYIFRYGPDGQATTLLTLTTGGIYDLVVEAPERITYAGSFSARVARVNIQGTAAIADTTFTPPTFNGGSAFSIAPRNGGGYVVAGSFSSVGGSTYSHLIKIGENGAIDTTFRPTNALSVSSWIYLRELSDGKVVYGGLRYLPTGATDSTWTAQFNPNNWPTTVTDMTMTLDGKLIVVGTFTSVGGQTRRGIVRLTTNGSVDQDFTSPTSLSGSLIGAGLGVNGRLHAGGSVTGYNGTTVNRLVRINHEPTDIAFVTQPAAIAANLGSSATLSAQAYGSSTLSYRWLKDGTALAEGGRFSGTATASLTINPVERGDAGEYRLEITNLAGTRLSNPATLTVLAEPVLLASPSGGTQPVGANVTLAASFSGATPLTYTWTRNGNLISNAGRFSGATSASLVITGITLEDTGTYVATATNAFGAAQSQPAAITVVIPPASLDASIPASLSINSTVAGLVPLADGRFLIGGSFTSVGGQSRQYLAVLNANGSVDTTFTPPTMNGGVTRIFGLADGSVLVSGAFTTVAGDTANYRYLYKLTPALALDTTFRPIPNSNINAIVEETGGTLLLGGSFTTVGGITTHPYLARINASTGAFDTSLRAKVNSTVFALVTDGAGRVVVGGQFSASGTDSASGGPGYLARIAADGTLDTWNPGANTTVYALAHDASGRILAGGNFTSFSSGTVSRQHLARFLADGTVDPDFNPAPNSSIRSIAIQDNGSILVSGSYTSIASTSANRLARLLPSGAIDPSWEIGTGLGSSGTHFSDPIVIQPDGRIWIMGSFTTYKGTSVTYLARLNGDPVDLAISRDLPALVVVQPGATFTLPAGATGTSTITYTWTRDGSAVADGGRISGATTSTLQVTGAVAGDSGTYRMTATNAAGARQTRPAQVVVLDKPVITREPVGASVATATNATLRVEALGAGTLTYQWRHNGQDLTNGGRITGASTATLTITGLTLADDGDYTVVVTNSLGSATSAVATLDVFAPPAGIDPSFNPANAAGNTVFAVAVEPSGSVLIGGSFLGGQARLARILPSGTRDTTFAPLPNQPVGQITPLADGKMFVSGGFSQITGVGQLYLARLNANGTRDTTFAPPGAYTPTATTIASHVVLPDGKVMIAGNFSAIGGVARAGFARLNANGTLDTTFVPTGTSGTGRAILPLADGGFLLGFSGGIIKVGPDGTKDNAFTLTASSTVTHLAQRGDGGVIVIGDFGAFNGVNRAFLAALNPNLTHDASWGSSVSLNNSISAVAVQPNGKVILGGYFTGNLRRLNADGTADASFTAGTFGSPGSPPVQAITVDTLGPIWVAGQFATYAGTQANNLVKLNGDPVPLTILDQPDAIAVDVGGNASFSVTAAGTSALSYQWRKDGVNLANGGRIAGATTATLTLTGVTRDDAGVYDVIVSNASGELPSAEAVLTVRAEPVLLTSPASRVVASGAPLSLAATFSGASPITYAWTFQGAPVSGATGATLDLGTADAAEAGLYVVTATNALGQASSEPVSVSVAVPASGSLAAWPAAGHAPNGAVWRVELLADGKAYVAGAFTQVGSTSRVGIARYLADGTLDTSFTSPFINNGTVIHDVRVLADGSLYAAGLFSPPTGASSGGIVRLTSTGAVDTGFQAPSNPFSNFTLYRVRVDSQGRVYVAGNIFVSASWGWYGRLSSTGVLDPTYLAYPQQYGGYGADLHLLDDTGTALVGGRLALGNGAFLHHYKVTPPNAAPDFTYAGALGANSDVWRILPVSGGSVLVGGNFTGFAGQSRGGLVKLGADGSVDLAFDGTAVGSGGAFVRDLAPGPNGTTWVAGEFNTFNGSTVGYLTRVGTTGAIDTSWYAGGTPTAFADGNVHALAPLADGGIIAGGAFANVRGTARPFLARVNGANPDAALRFTAEPVDTTVEEGERIVLRAAAVGGTGLAFQWLKGGSTLPGRTGPELVIASAAETDEGEYSVVITSGTDSLTSSIATVTVGTTPPAPTFATWIAGFSVPSGNAGALDDADGDGTRNLAAFAYGMVPVGGDRSRLPAATTVTIDGQRYVQFSYVRRTDAPSLTYQVRAATTLTGLSSPDLATEPVGDPVPLDATTERVTVRVTAPIAGTARAFVDLLISVNPGP